MIRSFRSRALKRYWENDEERKLPAADIPKIRRILDTLDGAFEPQAMDVPGFHFHPLKGDSANRFAVTVRANWRITFAWEDEDAIEVDYEDYH